MGPRRTFVLLAVTAALVTAVAPSARSQEPVAAARTVVAVDLAGDIGPVNPKLGGLSWNAGPDLGPVEGIRPGTVRVDARLEDISRGPDDLDLAPLLAKVAEIRRIGAEPLVILSYMPAWLAEPTFGRSPNLVPPSDLDVWEGLIESVVRGVATAPAPAHRFEVWNEPDLPSFWQDVPEEFFDMAVRTHRAVQTVATETGLPLEIGGPATAAPEPFYITPYVERMAREGLPLDFVSWHYYANHPFFGPDGNEGFVPDAVYEANARRNPAASPSLYGSQADLVRGFIAPALLGTGLDPDLLITEWNISAGGYDFRHATHEGAGFALGTLTELERSGLDGSDFYRAVAPDPAHAGDWATATSGGERRPSWWAIQAWNDTVGGRVLPVTGDGDAFWARAARRADGRVDVFLSTFASEGDTARAIDVRLDGMCGMPMAEIGRLDPGSAALDTYAPVSVSGRTIAVDVPTNSAAVVRITCGAD